MKIETPVVDVLLGTVLAALRMAVGVQPNTGRNSGGARGIYGRTPQLRVSKTSQYCPRRTSTTGVSIFMLKLTNAQVRAREEIPLRTNGLGEGEGSGFAIVGTGP